jgi:hypothetical protein
MADPATRCPSAPESESHRWQLPPQGEAGPARCKWCHRERTFPVSSDTHHWDTSTAKLAERGQRGAQTRQAQSVARGLQASHASRQQRKAGA